MVKARRGKISSRSSSVAQVVDDLFFVLATGLVLWLGWLLLREVRSSWQSAGYVVVLWLLLAYVGLPRLQEVLARLFVPDYYIGRTLTSTGILGDPVNLALRGGVEQVHASMVRAGWTRADELTLRSAAGIVVSAVFRRSYVAAPVSPLLLFGARQAFAYEQQVGHDAAQRHHVRFWPVPPGWILPGGHAVDWLAAGTFDRAVGLSLFTLQVTHKVDADIDVERDHVVATLSEGHHDVAVEVLVNHCAAFHSRNGGGDVVRTDGDLIVVDLDAVAAPPSAPPPATRSARFPPPTLVTAGLLGLAKTVLALTGLGLASLASLGVMTLWLLTLARSRWARLLLMALVTVEAAVRLAAYRSGSALSLLETGVSVLVLIAVSSDDARRWVHRVPSP